MSPWKCPDCGTWWSGAEHRCAPTRTSTGTDPDWGNWTIRTWPEPTSSGSSSSAPYCSICAGWHIPGHGDCNRSWCKA